MKIEFDTNNLSAQDIQVLAFITGSTQLPVNATATNDEPKATPAPAKKAPAKAAAKPAPEPEPEADEEVPTSEEAGDTGDEDLVGGPTMSDAVAAATKLVSSGGAAKVKAALAEVGAKRVSEMSESDIPAFLAALEN